MLLVFFFMVATAKTKARNEQYQRLRYISYDSELISIIVFNRQHKYSFGSLNNEIVSGSVVHHLMLRIRVRAM